MTLFRVHIWRSLFCIAMPTAVALGQGPTFELGGQLWTGRAQSAAFSHQTGVAFDAVATLRGRELARGAVIVGAGVGVRGLLPHGDQCFYPPGRLGARSTFRHSHR